MLNCLAFILATALALQAVQAQNESESKVVQIRQGPVRGYKDRQYDVFAFYDIPYATVTERFKAPGAPPSWNETFEAVERGIRCHQGRIFRNIEYESMRRDYNHVVIPLIREDCLVANVFTPTTDEKDLPVLVNVHGGAFQVGSGMSESHRTLVQERKIVAVNFNYRVGAFGFLCLGTKGAPGNAGLKDQLALLRWVKENIASFGGNPDDVTISGCSAGGASVDILTLSSATKGLFTKVITNSGAHLGVFAVQGDPIKNAKHAAKIIDFDNVDDLEALEEFYKTATAMALTTISLASNEDAGVNFSPCVEKDLGEEAILLEAPYDILKRGDHIRYPTLYGFTDLEGILRLSQFQTWAPRMTEKFSDFLPGDLQFENEEQREEVAKTVRQFYFGDLPVNQVTITAYLDYFADVKFIYSMLRSVKLNVKSGNATFFLHKYTFTDRNSRVIPFTNITGAPHCAQHIAVIDEDVTTITDEYRNMKTIMRTLWNNFIKTGAPVPEDFLFPKWPPVGADRSPHLHLSSTIELQGFPVEERTRLWDDIYAKHYRPPRPPTTGSAVAIRSSYLIYLVMLYCLLFCSDFL